ncbi:hypothetical protein [Dyella tabacisoli]|uniref:Uncharacterized protein n=1 Tax=Dyella tabacisoli TaxID=2282381 RepID=A0A369UUT5_9GAMM|nr:hypothetical protein [Dyella tabacisoli]RDD82109.1 hypothetical protein DVJ77_08590 [Dyella tabacisoli]
MKKIGIKTLLVAGSCLLCSLNLQAATIRDNIVTFSFGNSPEAQFSTSSYSITSGQPWGGISGGNWTSGSAFLKVRAGRKKSSTVGNWFNTQAQGGVGLGTNDFKNRPAELNFAAKGTITFTKNGVSTTCQNFVIAQGNFSSTNNWWLTAPGMALVSQSGAEKKTSLQCTRNGAQVTVYFIASMSISANSYRVEL